MEIFADLNSSGIYLSGDQVKCEIAFSNIHQVDPESLEDKLEHVAWSSVQIQCVCQVANNNVAPSRRESESNEMVQGTSLQPQKDAFTQEVFSTKPKILFCDLTLERGESKVFQFEDQIPISAPHSYNGRGIKYAYRVIVATQRLNQPICSLKLPFRVFSVSNLTSEQDTANPNQQQLKPTITNPFLVKESKDSGDKSNSILNLLQEPSARRVATFYDVKNMVGRVGRLCLFKTSFRLGEEIMGLFDFSESESQCMQYSVSLFCEEQLKSQGGAVKRPKTIMKQSHQEFSFGYDEVKNITKNNFVFNQFNEIFSLLQTNFTLPIPLHGTPSFSDEKCSLDWMLRFEFVIAATNADPISRQPVLDQSATEGHEWNGPAHVQVETMTWNLPITVLPTNPNQVAHVVNVQTQYSMLI